MTLGERIKTLRQKAGLTQEELAKEIGYSTKTSISKMENDVLDINQSTIVALARALKTTPSVLMGWSECPSPLPAPPPSANEQELLTIYRNVNEDGQDYIMETARMVEGAERFQKPSNDEGDNDDEDVVYAVARGGNGGRIKLKKRPGAGSILDKPTYKGGSL